MNFLKTITNRSVSILVVLLFLTAFSVFAQTTSFTYQGRFTDTSVSQPTSGTYNMQFALFDAVSGGTQVGTTITNPSVQVTSGVFTVALDFGANSFPGADRFLEINVYNTATSSYLTLTPRQQVTSVPYSVRTLSAGSADSLSSACVGCVDDAKINTVSGSKVTGTVGLTNGGTGATTAANARTNLGLGTLATVSPTGTANSTTYLRGDNTWATFSGLTGTGTTNYHTKFTGASTIGNSLIQDNGTNLSVNIAPSASIMAYFFKQQLTINGDGQHTLMGYRTRDSQNDGTSYSQNAANTGVAGNNFWGDLYTFGVGGWSYNDYTRTGGVIGAEIYGTYWGSLGYRNSASTNFGVYGSSAYSSGTGATNSDKQGIGGGFYGGMIGSWSRGEVIGSVSMGEMFATYNVGNVYTSGFTADVVNVTADNGVGTERVAAYTVTSPELKVYDNGSAKIDGESVFVPFSKSYAGMLSDVPNVTVSAVGSPAQLYIKSITKEGFVVAAASGTVNANFGWIAVGNRVDAEKAKALPTQLANDQFDNQLKDAMFNENNKEDSGKAIWWDGKNIRTDKAPEPQKAAKTEVQP